MTPLLLKTEYSFLKAFGQIDRVVAAVQGATAAGICDDNTWGHIPWFNACKAANIKPILGATIVVQEAITENVDTMHRMSFVAKSNAGLEELYQLTSLAESQKYYAPRLSYDQVLGISDQIIIFNNASALPILKDLKCLYLDVNPASIVAIRSQLELSQQLARPIVAQCDNRFPRQEDRQVFELLEGRIALTPQFIMTETQLRRLPPMKLIDDAAYSESDRIAEMCNVEMPKAENLKAIGRVEDLCRAGIIERGINWTDAYEERLQRELKMIRAKKFTDYFLIISDMVREAKKTMLVGPARGSAAGSLVCYLLFITEVDPLRFNLLFERFIDVSRNDLPDIDLDFPDSKREQVIEYLRQKYGADRIAHIGTVSRYQPKSLLIDVGKKLNIKAHEFKLVRESLITRNDGDARANQCLIDTLNLETVRPVLDRFPALAVAAELEGHVRHSGVHAAGIILCDDKVSKYCTVNREGIAQIDMKDAVKINLLKIDILGLRTLSVLTDAIEFGKIDVDLYKLPLDDPKVFSIFNAKKFAGIFQFEGQALQHIAPEIDIKEFNDIVTLTAIVRPGPLNSGGTRLYVLRHTEREKPTYAHELMRKHTESTLGVIIYQEQMMNIVRDIGQMSWEDVSALRKAMAKSQGEEVFKKYEKKFHTGAAGNGLTKKQSDEIWETLITFGKYGFNYSHAVSYALISYWTAWFKAYHPLAFAVACLHDAKDDEQTIRLLREMVTEGFEYVAFDPERSQLNWSIQDGKLYGGLIGIKGIGEAKAQVLMENRANGTLTKQQQELLANPDIFYAYDNIFPTKTLWGDIYDNPEKNKIVEINGPVSYIGDITDGDYCVIGRLIQKEVRDLNDYEYVARRDGKKLTKATKWLYLRIEDDTGQISCMIGRYSFDKLTKKMGEADVGSWWLVRGTVKKDFHMIDVENIKRLDDEPDKQEAVAADQRPQTDAQSVSPGAS